MIVCMRTINLADRGESKPGIQSPPKPRPTFPLWWRRDTRRPEGGYWVKKLPGDKSPTYFGSDAAGAESRYREELIKRGQNEPPARRAAEKSLHPSTAQYLHLLPGLAKRVSRRMPRRIERCDLEASGVFGIDRALRNPSRDRAVPLETWVSMNARWAMLQWANAAAFIPVRYRRRGFSIIEFSAIEAGTPGSAIELGEVGAGRVGGDVNPVAGEISLPSIPI